MLISVHKDDNNNENSIWRRDYGEKQLFAERK